MDDSGEIPGDHSLYLAFPVSRLGLASYFLAAVYVLLSFNAYKRLSRISSYARRGKTLNLFHASMFLLAITRTIAFSIISAFSVWNDSHTPKSHSDSPALVVLFIFPEFLFITSFMLLFLTWLEMYIFSHEQYVYQLRSFQYIWRLLFGGTTVALVILQAIFYTLLFTGSDSAAMLTVIYDVLIAASIGLPALFFMIRFYFECFVLSGFPFSSAMAQHALSKLGRALYIWSACRIVRGVVLWVYYIDADWGDHVSVDFLSVLVVGSVLIAEIIPINVMLDWSTVSLLLLCDSRGHLAHRNLLSDEESLFDDGPDRINPNDLQVSAAGLVHSGELFNIVKGSWKDNRVTIVIFHMADVSPMILEELTDDVARISCIEHQHIAQTHGTCLVNGDIYVVHEVLRRGPLFNFLSQVQVLETDIIIRMAKQLCMAIIYLQEMHECCHGMLSSKCILLDDAMDIKVLNIGLQKVRAFSEIMMVTRIMTAWTSPEQLKGGTPTMASDVYSFGVVLWELCTQSEPFPGRDSGWFRKYVAQQHARPQLLPSQGIDGRFIDIMKQCWASHPLDRPTFPEILHMLDDISL